MISVKEHEDRSEERVHTRYEHVVSPHDERQDRNEEHRTNHRLVTEDRLT